ncbi:MAG TPA: hypothetical protein VMW89_03510 [Desulfatiglandales bacterium]|nr:hypothetical protein [Desulfatiglandales bacterium]
MKRIIFTLMLALAVAMFSPSALAAEEEPEALPDIIEKEAWIVFIDEPAGYFQDARKEFLNGDLHAAAQDILAGTVIIKLETHRAKGEVREALKASTRELRDLAKAVEKGAVASGGMIEEAFARAEFVLAQHHYQKALDYETKGDYEMMAYAVDAAARHLLYASFWADEDLEEDNVVAIKEGRSLVRELIRRAAWGPKKMGEAVKSVARGLQEFGKKMKPLKEKPEE